jgi:glycosyltransferase involved in cell wall biosynthesis
MFVAAGDGPYRSTFEQRARELGADETQVRFPGRISDEDLALSYQGADLFVLPTRALEGFGLIVVEAMSYGLPVLGTDVGAIPELVRPIAPELIVPPGDAGALGDRVKRWLDGSLVAPTPEAMAEYVDQRFDRAAIVPRQLELLGLGAREGRDARH